MQSLQNEHKGLEISTKWFPQTLLSSAREKSPHNMIAKVFLATSIHISLNAMLNIVAELVVVVCTVFNARQPGQPGQQHSEK